MDVFKVLSVEVVDGGVLCRQSDIFVLAQGTLPLWLMRCCDVCLPLFPGREENFRRWTVLDDASVGAEIFDNVLSGRGQSQDST